MLFGKPYNLYGVNYIIIKDQETKQKVVFLIN